MHRPYPALRSASLATSLVVALTACGPLAPSDGPSGVYRAPSTPTPTFTTSPSLPDSKRDRTKKDRPAFDNDLNLASAVIDELGRMADVYGYGLSPGSPLSYEQAIEFAYAVSLTCDFLDSGAMTFNESVREDIQGGAPPSDARGFNRYLDRTFCPAYIEAGN